MRPQNVVLLAMASLVLAAPSPKTKGSNVDPENPETDQPGNGGHVGNGGHGGDDTGTHGGQGADDNGTHEQHNKMIYLIRHGEKPADGGKGLSAQGVQRAQCLTGVFGKKSGYDIGYILAEKPKKGGDRERPYETVKPLAKSLGLSVDTSCDKNDMKCVAKKIKNYKGKKNILICWEHGELHDITAALGAEHPPTYDGAYYDKIWTMERGDDWVLTNGTEICPNIHG